ncbi:MAG: TolB family protein [Planctomycetota bacterium]
MAFTTAATNLVPNDTNGTLDVMVRDLVAGTTSRASVSTGGVEGNGSSKLATISADGRYVAFESDATNLVPGDTNLATDIFLRDLQAQTTSRVSLRPNGNQCNGFSFGCSISADGRYLAFYSSATNVVQGDTNNRTDVFVRDLLLGTNVRVSESSTGLQGEGGDSVCPMISADGRFVVFSSDATNLVPNDTNGEFDLFVQDLQTGALERVSVGSNGVESNHDTWIISTISADGRYVAFTSTATNLAEDVNGVDDVFVHDRETGETRCVSVDSAGIQSNAQSKQGSISGNGRYVAFFSNGDNLVPNDTNAVYDIFLYDMFARKTTRISVDDAGNEGTAGSRNPWLSLDGRYVLFTSGASNLVPNDLGFGEDFVRDRRTTEFDSFCFGDGSLATACPCAPPNTVPNPSGAAGHGCANSFALAGAELAAGGTLAPDEVVFRAEVGINYIGFAFLVKGNAQSAAGFANGDGVRCVDGALIRVGGHAAGTNGAPVGSWTYPNLVQTTPITQITAQGPGLAWYQLFYRNATPGFCSAGTTNWTNGVSVTWPP